jgi:hypothetical protein
MSPQASLPAGDVPAPRTERRSTTPESIQERQLLAHLETLLDEGDMRVGSVLEESAPIIERALGEDAARLRQELTAFRFDSALLILREAIARRRSRPAGRA